jgi:hypothetical protein
MASKVISPDHCSPDDSVPGLIGQVEDKIFRLVVDGPPENLLPIFQVDPRFFRGTSRERGEALQAAELQFMNGINEESATHAEEFEQDASQRPIIG